MANIRSFPNNQDEYIGAEEVMRWHHGRSSGVFGADGNAAVSPVLDTMAVTVSDGIGWLSNDEANGIVWWVDNEAKNGAKLQLAIDMADAARPRVDRVVVSWQTANYVALPEVIILKGTPAITPVPPALTNDNLVRQISLAAIRIPAGATKIDASMITDERLDASVCGIVTAGVGVDTTVMQAQYASFLAEQRTYAEQQKRSWEAYFASVQDDTLVPVPAAEDAGKAMLVNETGDGYVLSEIQTEIPVTSEVPEDADMWIDPDDETQIITPESIGAAPAGNYATESFVTNKIAEAQLSGGGGGDIDLSGYATKDDLTKISHPVNSVNGKTGAVQLSASDVGARPSTWMPTASQVGARPNTWTPTAAQVGARASTWLPTPQEINAVPANPTDLSGMSVKDWAVSLSGSAYALASPTTTDLPVEVASSSTYAIVKATVITAGKWIELRVTYVLTGCVAVLVYNNGWGEWEWENPQMALGVEYRTTERWYGYPVYTKLVDMGALPNNSTKEVLVSPHAAGGRIFDAWGFENASGQKIPSNCFANKFDKCVELPFSGLSLWMHTNFDGSSYAQALITVKYIKY